MKTTVGTKTEGGAEIIAVFANDEYGIESIVAQHGERYSMAVKDVDAGEVVPTIVFWTGEGAKEKAIAAAQKAAR